jgi:hypothetical protein
MREKNKIVHMAGKDFSTLKRYEELEALDAQFTNKIEQL